MIEAALAGEMYRMIEKDDQVVTRGGEERAWLVNASIAVSKAQHDQLILYGLLRRWSWPSPSDWWCPRQILAHQLGHSIVEKANKGRLGLRKDSLSFKDKGGLDAREIEGKEWQITWWDRSLMST